MKEKMFGGANGGDREVSDCEYLEMHVPTGGFENIGAMERFANKAHNGPKVKCFFSEILHFSPKCKFGKIS